MSRFLIDHNDFKTLGAPLTKEQLPKILFRFPGPCGLSDLSMGKMKTLSPSDLPNTFLFKDRFDFVSEGIQSFGVFTILNPADFEVVCLDDETLSALNYAQEDRGRIFLGTNRPVQERLDFLWMPSRIYNMKSQWSQISAESLKEIVFDSNYESERESSFESVNHYMEEVGQIEKKIGPLSQPWYSYSGIERKETLKKAGILSNWTK